MLGKDAKNDSFAEGCLAIIGLFTATFVAILISPLYVALLSGLGGWILHNLFPMAGDWIVTGAGYIGLHIQREQLPFIGTALGYVGGFFRSSTINNKK